MTNEGLNKNEEKKSLEGNSDSYESKVFIKKEAFRNMMIHVLRFGNDALESSSEVMGVCLGKFDSNQNLVILEKAVPLIHGEKVEIGFSKEDYELFSQVEKEHSSNLVGYYHSHPSWGLYLSETDIKNLQYFQTEKRSYAFSIVFDHTLMGKDKKLGFEIYRLDDSEKYHDVEYEVEIPASLEYFRWIQKFVEDFQKVNPILIMEKKEKHEEIPGELIEIPTSEDEIIDFDEKKDMISNALSSIQDGTKELGNVLSDTMKVQINKWLNELSYGSINGLQELNVITKNVRESISSGFIKLDNWFKKNLDTIVNNFRDSAQKSIDKRISDYNQIVEEISELKNTLINNVNTLIKDNMMDIDREIDQINNSFKDLVDKSQEIRIQVDNSVSMVDKVIPSVEDGVNTLSKNIEDNLDAIFKPIETNIDEKIKKLTTELQPFKEYNSEIRILIEKLQKIITGFRNLA